MEKEINEIMYFSPSYNFLLKDRKVTVAAVEAGGSQGDDLHNSLTSGAMATATWTKAELLSLIQARSTAALQPERTFLLCHFCVYIILWDKTLNDGEIFFCMPLLPVSLLFLCWALVAGSIHHPLFSQQSLLLPRFHLKFSENLTILVWASW